jgi:hypothetical protein
LEGKKRVNTIETKNQRKVFGFDKLFKPAHTIANRLFGFVFLLTVELLSSFLVPVNFEFAFASSSLRLQNKRCRHHLPTTKY